MANVNNGNQTENVAVRQNIIQVDDPLYLHSSDHSSLVLVNGLLNENNYMSWSRSMKTALEARDKFGFITGADEIPDETDPKYKQWRKVNSTLVSWIRNALSSEISSGFVFTDDARQLWEELKEQFAGSDGHRIYELRRSVYTAKQGGDSVAVYYNRVKRFWDELNILAPNPSTTAKDEKMMQFLMGLGDEYDGIRNQILALVPLPTVAKAYSMVVDVEKRRVVHGMGADLSEGTVMLTKSSNENKHQGVVAYTDHKQSYMQNSMSNGINRGAYRRKEDKSHLRCEFCGKTGHVKTGCFKLIGFPEWWPGSKPIGINKGMRSSVNNVFFQEGEMNNVSNQQMMNSPLDYSYNGGREGHEQMQNAGENVNFVDFGGYAGKS